MHCTAALSARQLHLLVRPPFVALAISGRCIHNADEAQGETLASLPIGTVRLASDALVLPGLWRIGRELFEIPPENQRASRFENEDCDSH